MRCVRYNGSRDSAYAPFSTRTEYPYGTDNCRVTTDPFGVQTIFTRSYPGNADAETTASAGVTNATTTTWGGATTTEKTWTDPVSSERLSLATRTSKDWDANGCATETVSERRNGGEWMTRSVTARNFLGRETAASQVGHGGAMLVTSNTYDSAGRTVMAVGSDGARNVYAYGELGEIAGTVRIGAGQQLSFDPQSFTLANVTATDAYAVTETPAWKEYGDLGLASNGVQQAWWECTATVQHNPGQGAVTTSVQRVQLTGLSAACVKRTVSTDINGDVRVTMESLEAGEARTTVASVNMSTAATAASLSVAGVRIENTNSIGAATSYTFDGFARQVTATETAGSRILQQATGYHGDGSVAFSAEICGAVSNVTTYSQRQYLQQPEGAYTVTTTDALGNGTISYYSGDGTLYRSEGAVYPAATARDTDGRQSELRTWRDEAGAPDITRWHYDAASGLVTNKVYTDGNGPAYTYRADGRILSRTWARGTVTEYGYADTTDGSAMTVTYNDGTPSVSNSYNLAGQPVYISDGTGGRTLSYNTKGRQTAETNLLAAITRRYDVQGLPSEFSVDNDATIAYAYDNLMRLTNVNVGGLAFGYAYLPHTRLHVSVSNSCGSGWSRSYEGGRNLIATLTNFHGSSVIAAYAYGNDVLGRRVTRNGDTFAYNVRSELTNATFSADIYGYGYDGIGNLLFSACGTATNTYVANALNQYTAITGGAAASPTYDLDGNMLTNGVWDCTWDAENRLNSVESNGVTLVSNAYDYLGRRFQKISGALTRTFVYDGWNLYREVETSGGVAVTNIYVWGLDLSGTIQGAGGVGGLLAVLRNGTPYFPCYDANGNVTEYVDAGGTVVAHREYDPFGKTTVATGPLVHDLHFWFSSRYLDEETGLYYYGYRFYAPERMRWLSRDPIGEEGGPALYSFCSNTPVNGFDSHGLTANPGMAAYVAAMWAWGYYTWMPPTGNLAGFPLTLYDGYTGGRAIWPELDNPDPSFSVRQKVEKWEQDVRRCCSNAKHEEELVIVEESIRTGQSSSDTLIGFALGGMRLSGKTECSGKRCKMYLEFRDRVDLNVDSSDWAIRVADRVVAGLIGYWDPSANWYYAKFPKPIGFRAYDLTVKSIREFKCQ